MVVAVTMATTQADGIAEKYQKTCALCHAVGIAGAVKAFDATAWSPKLKLGMDVLVASVKNGKAVMPPKGLCSDCSDADYAALIEYMSKPKQ